MLLSTWNSVGFFTFFHFYFSLGEKKATAWAEHALSDTRQFFHTQTAPLVRSTFYRDFHSISFQECWRHLCGTEQGKWRHCLVDSATETFQNCSDKPYQKITVVAVSHSTNRWLQDTQVTQVFKKSMRKYEIISKFGRKRLTCDKQ